MIFIGTLFCNLLEDENCQIFQFQGVKEVCSDVLCWVVLCRCGNSHAIDWMFLYSLKEEWNSTTHDFTLNPPLHPLPHPLHLVHIWLVKLPFENGVTQIKSFSFGAAVTQWILGGVHLTPLYYPEPVPEVHPIEVNRSHPSKSALMDTRGSTELIFDVHRWREGGMCLREGRGKGCQHQCL